jgi:CRISPR/Cas system CMR-associated protein Cmr1 (group 7 of RAMP superfamily)
MIKVAEGNSYNLIISQKTEYISRSGNKIKVTLKYSESLLRNNFLYLKLSDSIYAANFLEVNSRTIRHREILRHLP